MSTLQLGAKPGTAGTIAKRQAPAPAKVETPFGSTILAGGFPWGPTDKVPVHSGEGDYLEQRHLPIEGDPINVQCEHWYEMARGAGRLATLRLVDGNERKAFRDMYGKDQSSTHKTQTPYAPPTRLFRVEGLYPGNRGGRLHQFQGYSANRAAAFSAAAGTYATGLTLKVNEWERAVLHFTGTTTTYPVTGNTVAGLLSIDVPLGDTGPTGAGMWYITRTALDPYNDTVGLGVHTLPSDRNPTTEFSLGIVDANEDRIVDPRYKSMGLDPTLASYLEKVSKDGAQALQHSIDATVYDSGVGSVTRQPATWSGYALPTSGTDTTATLQTWFWSRTSPGGGNAYLDPSTIAYPSRTLRCRAKCTFTAPTTFDVEYQDWQGGIVLSDGLTVANGVGGALNTLFTSSGPFPSFKLQVGTAAMAATDVIYVYFNPIPADVSPDGYLIPSALTAPRTRYSLASTTTSSATILTSGGLSTMTPAGPPTVTAAPTAGPYDMSVAGNRDFSFELNQDGVTHTVTSTLVGAAETATALAANLVAQAAIYFAGINMPVRINFTTGTKVAADDTLAFNLLWDWGTGSEIEVKTAGMGAIIGYGVDTAIAGTNGTMVALAYHDLLEFGRDGHHGLAAADYSAAFDLSTSLLNDLASQRLGLFKVAAPGVYGYTEQAAIEAWCDANGHEYRGEIDPTLLAGYNGAANSWRNGMAGSENTAVACQSYGYPRIAPFRGQETAIPLTGAILGAEAYLAAREGGYHKAAAGEKMNIGRLFRDLVEITSGEAEPGLRVEEALLNDTGIQPILKRGALIYPNGDENAADYWRGTVWKHKVECILHIMHLCLEVGDLFTWEANDIETRTAIANAARAPLQDLYEAGWFRVEDGETFLDVVQIDASGTQNPPSVTSLGQARVVITVSGIVDTIKNVVFVIGTGGVSVGSV